MQNNPIGWVEIPVSDMERAIEFYQQVFDTKLEKNNLGPLQMAWFPMDLKSYGTAASLVKNENYKPQENGVLVYFTAKSGDLSNELRRAEQAGAKVLSRKKQIGEHGFMALILDTEGNRIALHSMK